MTRNLKIVELERLLANLIQNLNEKGRSGVIRCIDIKGVDLEDIIFNELCEVSRNTVFHGSIKKIGGQKFPDIVVDSIFGIEVKSSKDNKWTSTGNSIKETTRVESVENIYLVFGKCSPVEFKYRRYQDCLSGIKVTHSPRYTIDMDLEENKSIFQEVSVPYDEFRTKDPIEIIKNYYRSLGQDVWWIDKESSINIKFWNSLSNNEKTNLTIELFIRFPEILGPNQDKYNAASLWLINEHSIICPNIRDLFSSGGREILSIGTDEINVRKVIAKAIKYLPQIEEKAIMIAKTERNLFGLKVSKENVLKVWVMKIDSIAPEKIKLRDIITRLQEENLISLESRF